MLAKAAQQRQQELNKEQQDAQQRDKDIAQREQGLDQQRKEADESERLAGQKTQEAQQERQGIAKDQQEMIDGNKGTPVAAAQGTGKTNGLLGAGIVFNNSSLGRLARVDPANGSVIQTSGMNTVNTRTITLSGSRIFAIAGVNQGNGAIRLVEISNDTLEMVKQGEDDIHPNSLLWANGSNLYAIIVANDKNYLARFDSNLVRQAQSETEVHPFGSCIFQNDKILTQSANGNPLVLNGQTLK